METQPQSPTAPTTAPYEGFKVTLRPAPFGKRLGAYLIDQAICSLLLYAVFIVAALIFGSVLAAFGETLKHLQHKKGGLGFVLVLSGGLFLFFIAVGLINDTYFIYQEYKKGTTIGKRVFGLRVVSIDGRALTLGKCIIRSMMRYIDLYLVLPGLLSVLLSKRSQRLGDMMAGTLVVHSVSAEAAQQFLYMKQPEYLQILHQLGPTPPRPEVAEHFMRFYLQASLGVRIGSEAETWRQRAVFHYMPKAAESGLNLPTLYRFFAEHCNQTLANSHKGPNP